MNPYWDLVEMPEKLRESERAPTVQGQQEGCYKGHATNAQIQEFKDRIAVRNKQRKLFEKKHQIIVKPSPILGNEYGTDEERKVFYDAMNPWWDFIKMPKTLRRAVSDRASTTGTDEMRTAEQRRLEHEQTRETYRAEKIKDIRNTLDIKDRRTYQFFGYGKDLTDANEADKRQAEARVSDTEKERPSGTGTEQSGGGIGGAETTKPSGITGKRGWLNDWESIQTETDPLIKLNRVQAFERNHFILSRESKRALGVKGYQFGGHIPGYGGGDRVPTFLERGEFVVRKEAAREFLPELSRVW
jgi:hypothetical protein